MGPDVNRKPWLSRPGFVIPACFAVAAVAGLLAQRLAPAGYGDVAAICAAWIAFSPIPRLKPTIPWWLHWVEGVFILLGFWLMTRAPA